MLNSLKDLDDFIDVNDISLTTLIYTDINHKKIINNNVSGLFLPENLYIDDSINYDKVIENEIRKHKLNKILNSNNDDECVGEKSHGNTKKIIIDCDIILPSSKRYFVNNHLKSYSKHNMVILLRVNLDNRPYYSKMPKKLLYQSSLVASFGSDKFKVIKKRYG